MKKGLNKNKQHIKDGCKELAVIYSGNQKITYTYSTYTETDKRFYYWLLNPRELFLF